MKVIIIDTEIHGQLSKLECDLWNKIQFLAKHQNSNEPNIKEYIQKHVTPDKMLEIVKEIRAIYRNPNYVRGTLNLGIE